MICYDVFFADPARALATKGAEVILMPIWGGDETLAKARAIEKEKAGTIEAVQERHLSPFRFFKLRACLGFANGRRIWRLRPGHSQIPAALGFRTPPGHTPLENCHAGRRATTHCPEGAYRQLRFQDRNQIWLGAGSLSTEPFGASHPGFGRAIAYWVFN